MIGYTLIRSRRKTIAILIARDGSVTVRAPLKASTRRIVEFVQLKEAWIRSKQTFAKQLPALPRKAFQDGETFLFLGQSYPLKIIDKAKARLVLNHRFELATSARSNALQVFTGWYREQARRIFSERVAYYAAHARLSYQSIRISSARTRWGSCSARASLSFTWRLVMAPLPVIDYVIVHELVHTRVRNHSRAFWDEVKTILPGYKNQIGWLKTNGAYLTLGD